MLRNFAVLVSVLLLPFLAACATPGAYLGDSITQVDENNGYRLARAVAERPKDDLLVIVSLSGGGLRASAMAFGILEQLATDRIQHDGRLRRMLDEVDAPLDDTNVGRLSKLITQMSEQVQFIYITHNKIAMECAHQLIGVTMQEPGVSRIVSVNIDEAIEMVKTS